MEVIVIVLLIILLIYGNYMMGEMDNFFVKNPSASQEYPLDSKRCALIFSDSKPSKLVIESLEMLEFSCYLIDSSYIPKDLAFAVFFALSSDDCENLFMSRLINIKTKNVWIVARVNENMYSELYRRSGVNRIIAGELTSEKIIKSMRECVKA